MTDSAEIDACPRCGGHVMRTMTHYLCTASCRWSVEHDEPIPPRPIPPAETDTSDPDDPPATRDADPMWGRDIPPGDDHESPNPHERN